mmetsp:Transcript_120396/g.374876  ORF Transcript_120396/g.374876 Transcript_120396/m.374876 type:complete len:261 (-) Transcript_120396:60-842(-)|eukprot:CAMPEP_0204569400 /NCGR_PEP_ID=MMETSP0661-20131031/37723_1 /ASSEMBLY_ACC=CAM_ASM_000606 /TAXON_ID=109239 /ORGANISM="Alexandrium margalefi, Strain AMGDE01CS-322" /LENGTH=260 /DNA_ID=CAMNT_0051577497 /DNA_START=61 /DNA_END=843 /DNA_ORIENTATION=+
MAADAAAGGQHVPISSYLNQERAIQVDVDLMSPEGGFSIDQLMELAALSCASALAKEYPRETHPKVLIICGPGNNGGDGLVAARHLHHFGYKPRVVYPKMDSVIAGSELYRRLTVQLAQLSIPVTDTWTEPAEGDADVILDALFGFSFKGWRGGGKDAPFDSIIDFLSVDATGQPRHPAPLVSIDIPSGWDVEKGPPEGRALQPEMLISLTAPKLCAQLFKGKFHYLGGRFVPPSIVAKNELVLPEYPGSEQCVKLASAL